MEKREQRFEKGTDMRVPFRDLVRNLGSDEHKEGGMTVP